MHRALMLSAGLLRTVGRIELALAGLVLAAVVIVIVVQVALMAGLGSPIAWEQEGGAYALVWMTFLGASIALKQMRHVTITSVVGRAPEKVQALVRIFCWALVIWTLVSIIQQLIGIMPIEARASTVALPVDLPRSWFFSVPLFISSILMIWTSVHYLLANVARLFGLATGEPTPIMFEPASRVDLA